MRKVAALCFLVLPLLCWLIHSPAQEKPFNPPVAKASNEGLAALKRIQVPKGLNIDLFAAEPLLANPVSFSIDEKGRVFVAETFRIHKGVTDNRDHMDWLEDDIASRSVADRVSLYKKHLKDRFKEYEIAHDRVRMGFTRRRPASELECWPGRGASTTLAFPISGF
jgi:quinoprotein glucose dehydrogenase